MKTKIKKLITHIALTAFLFNAVPANMWDMLPQVKAADLQLQTIYTGSDNYKIGAGASIVSGTDGFARMAFYDTKNNKLIFIKCTDATCSTKITKELATVNFNQTSTDTWGNATSIALNSAGLPRIAYFDEVSKSLYHIACIAQDCSGTNDIDLIDSGTGMASSGKQHQVLKIDTNDKSMIWYSKNDKLNFAQCPSGDCTGATKTVADAQITYGIGEHFSLQLGSNGYPRIVYWEGSNMKFVTCLTLSCSSVSQTIPYSSFIMGGVHPEIQLKADGNAIFILNNPISGGNRNIRIVNCTTAACESSTIQTSTNLGAAADYQSFYLGNDGFPRIIYTGSSMGTLVYLKCKDILCSQSDQSTLGNNQSYQRSDLMLIKSTSNTPMVISHDNYSGVQYGICTDDACSSLVTPPPPGPVIGTLPATMSVSIGGAIALNINASGIDPLTYQWKKNGVNMTGSNIQGATTTHLQVSPFTAADVGDYTVTVSDSTGSATSNVSKVTFTNPIFDTALGNTPQVQGWVGTYSGSVSNNLYAINNLASNSSGLYSNTGTYFKKSLSTNYTNSLPLVIQFETSVTSCRDGVMEPGVMISDASGNRNYLTICPSRIAHNFASGTRKTISNLTLSTNGTTMDKFKIIMQSTGVSIYVNDTLIDSTTTAPLGSASPQDFNISLGNNTIAFGNFGGYSGGTGSYDVKSVWKNVSLSTYTPPALNSFAVVTNNGLNSVSLVNTETGLLDSTISVGTKPHGVALTPDGKYAYVTNTQSHNVSVITMATKTVTNTIPVGTLPEGIVASPDGKYMYVNNRGSNTVSVIDTTTNATVGSAIAVGTYPSRITITPNGQYLYVANYQSSNVSVISTSSRTVVKTIATSASPLGAQVSPDGRYVYVTHYISGNGSLSIIDTVTNTVTKSGIVLGNYPTDIAFAKDGKYAYISNFNSTVHVIDTKTQTVAKIIPLGINPQGIVLSPDGTHILAVGDNSVAVLDTVTQSVSSLITLPAGAVAYQIAAYPVAYPSNYYAYVANDKISLIDTSTQILTKDIPVETAPTYTALTPDGKFAYVANALSNSVSIIDTATQLVVKTLPVGTYPLEVKVTPDGKFAYVTNYQGNSISIIDTSTQLVVKTLPVENYPKTTAITPDGKFAYVANYTSNSVSVIDTTTQTVTKTLPVGTYPRHIAITPDSKFAYVANYQTNSVSIINTATQTVAKTVSVGTSPEKIEITPDGTFAYVTNVDSQSVSIINTTTQAVTKTLPVGMATRHMTITPDGKFVYVTVYNNDTSSSIVIIDTATQTIVKTLSGGSSPVYVAITPDSKFAYVANSSGHSISIIDTSLQIIVNTITVTGYPRHIAMIPGPLSTPDTTPPTVAIQSLNDLSTGYPLNTLTVNDNGTPTLMSATTSGVAILTYSSDNQGGSGVDQNTYQVNVNGTITSALPSVFMIQRSQLTPGINTITISVKDKAGNLASETRKLYLDDTPPTLAWKVNGTTVASPSSAWSKTPATVELSCADNTPGCFVAATYQNASSGAVSCTASSTYTFTGSSNPAALPVFSQPTSICAKAQDSLGTPTISQVYTLNIDTVSPSASITNVVTTTANKTIAQTGGVWYTNDNKPKIQFTATDATSGVASQTITVDSGTATTVTGNEYTLPTLSDGAHTITLTVTDTASNPTSVSKTISVSTAGPVLTGTLRMPLLEGNKSWGDITSAPLVLPTGTDLSKMVLKVFNETEGNIQEPLFVQITSVNSSGTTTSSNRSGNEITLSKDGQGNIEGVSLYFSPNRNDVTGFPAGTVGVLPRATLAGDQITYRAELTVYDSYNNSTTQVLGNIKFDTLAPSFMNLISFYSLINGSSALLNSTLIDGVNYIIYPVTTVRTSFSAQEETNSNTWSSSIFYRIKNGSTSVGSTSSSTNSSKQAGIIYDGTLPGGGFKGPLTFEIADYARNTASRTIQVWHDPTAPTVNAVTQVLTTPGVPTKDLTLNLSLSDNAALSTNVVLSTNGYTYNLIIPAGLLSSDKKTISGNWTIPYSSIPQLKEGASSIQIKIKDVAGNETTSDSISTLTDHTSPTINEALSNYSITPANISLNLNVTDISPLRTFFETTDLGKEATAATLTRMLSIANIALTGRSLPYNFSITDEVTTAATFSVQNGMSFSGTVSGTNFVVTSTNGPSALPAGNSTTLTITPPAGFGSPVSQTFSGLTGSISLPEAPKGNYTVQAVVTVPNKPTATFTGTLTNSTDLITPKITATPTLSVATAGKTMNQDGSLRYFTNDTSAKANFTFTPYTEQSFPVTVKVNGTQVGTFSSIPTGAQSVVFPLSSPNTPVDYTLEIADQAGNKITYLYKIIMDTQSSNPASGSSSNVALYKGTTGTFVADNALLLPYSTGVGAYLSDTLLAAFTVNAEDSWGNAPSVVIKKGATVIVPSTALTLVSGSTYTFTKKDVALDANATVAYTVEITDFAGNVKTVPLSIRQYISNPTIGSFTINTGDTTVNTPTIPGLISTSGSSTLSYNVIVDGVVVATGTLGNTSATDMPISIPLGIPGTHTVKVEIVDELGHRTETTPQTVIYDTTKPTISDITITAAANKKTLFENSKWYTNDTTPKLKVTVSDTGGSNVNPAKSKVQINGGAILDYTDNMTLPTLGNGSNNLVFSTEDFSGNPSSSQITIVLDTTTPYSLGGITIDSVSDAPNPSNFIKFNIPGAKDADTPPSIGTVGLEKVELQLINSKTGGAVDLTGKVSPTGYMAFDPADHTKIIITPDTNGSLPGIMTISNLDKTVSGEQTSYTLKFTPSDKLGNTSPSASSAAVAFDTLAPTFNGTVAVKDMPLRLADGKSWYILNQSAQSILANIQENTNSDRTKSMPISLKAYTGAARDLSTVTTFLINTTISSEGTSETPITFPANYGGEVTFVAVDAAGNISAAQTINVYTDTAAPSVPNGQVAVSQVPNASVATKDLTLALHVKDDGLLSHRVTLSYGGTNKDLTLPNDIFQNSDREISGNWTLTATDLAGFPQGARNELTVTFYDISNHPFIAGPAATNVDWISPAISNVSYAFKENKTKLDLTFSVQDTSKIQLLSGSNVLFSEGSFSTNPRTYTVRDIALSGASPYTFTVSDGLNPASVITVQDGFSLTRGAADINGNIPIQFVVNPAGTARTVDLQVAGPDGIPFSSIAQSYTTATGTLNLYQPPKGIYKVTATVKVDGVQTVYEQTISVTEDLIPISLGTTNLTVKTPGKSMGLDGTGTLYVTNDSALTFAYSFVPTVEQSFPVKVFVNGTEKANFASNLPTGVQTFDIGLSNPNVPQPYLIRFQDAAGNKTDITYTVVQDTNDPVAGTVGESFTKLYEGTAGTFSPTPDSVLKKSTLANEYLTSGSYAGIVVEATDSWGSPTVTVKANGGTLVANVPTTLKTGTTDTYTYQKGNITLAPDSVTPITVEVRDRAGNISQSTYNVRQVTEKPKITALTINNGKAQISSTSVQGSISVTATSAVRYEVLLGSTIIGSGQFGQANPMNAPIQFTLQNQGTNTIKVRVIDELNNSTESNPIALYLDTTPPQVDSITVKALTANTKAELKNNKWYTNDARPQIEVIATDEGSGLGAGATYSFSLNGGTTRTVATNTYQLESSLINGDNTVSITIKDAAGAPVTKVINIIYDTGAPEFTGSMTIKNIQDKPAPNHFVDIAIPGVKDKDTGGYGVSGIDYMSISIIDRTTSTAVSLTGKVTESATVSLSPTDSTALILKQDTNGNWPSSIIFTNLPKQTSNGTQITYTASLTASDLVGNLSNQTMDGIAFDTKAPSFVENPDFAPLSTRTFDGVSWTISKNKQVNVSFTSLEEVNTGRPLSLPLTLTVKSGSTVLATKSFDQIGRSSTQFDLPDNFKNTVDFTLTDAAGNTSAPFTAHLWLDTAAPQILAGNSAAVTQDLAGRPGTNTLPLLLKVQDPAGLGNTALVQYGSKSLTLPLPSSLFKDQGRQLDGLWTLTDQDLPEFPQGATNILSITFSDTAGNTLPVNNIAIKYDSESPKVNDMSYSFKNNNSQMDLSLTISDVSLLTVQYNGQQLLKETSASSKDRTLSLQNINLVGEGPYVFTVNDGINPLTQITISDGLSLSFGAPANEKVPLNFTLSGNGDLTQAQSAFTINGPTGFTTVSQTVTGKNGSITLNSPLKGIYTITTVVSIPGQNNVTYSNTLSFDQDIIAPKINDDRVGLSTIGSYILGNVNGTFYTSAPAISMKYAFTPYIEQSFPVDVYVNRVKQTSFSSLPTEDQYATITLSNANTSQTYTVEFVDAAGNTAKKDFTIVQDMLSPTHPAGSGMIKTYIGNSNFAANDTLLMKKSTVADEFITKDPLAAFVITAEDEWGNNPTVRIVRDGTEVLPPTTMTNVASTTFVLTKKDAALTPNALNTFTISISDIAGNTYSEVIKVRHDNKGPLITSLNFNDGSKETNKSNNFGSVSIDGTSSLSYKLLVDAGEAAGGAWSTADVSNAPLAFALGTQGDHSIVLKVTDELGQTTTSEVTVLTLDSIKPEATLTLKDASNTLYLSQKVDNSTTADPLPLTHTRDRVTGSGMSLEVKEGQDVHFPISILTDSTQKSLATLYAQTPAATLNDTNAIATANIPLLSEGLNTLSIMLKDSFGNARSASVQVIRDTEGPATTASVTETPEGNLTWNWNYADALGTAVNKVKIEVRNTNLGTVIYPKTGDPENFGTETKTWTLQAPDVRRGETYALTIIATDALGNDSLARTVSITPASNTYDAFNPLDKDPTPIPWQDDPSITEVKVTLTHDDGTTYTAVIPKTPTLDLETFIETASNGEKDKLPVGTYDVVIEPVTDNPNVVPAKVESTITITPYYMDEHGDLNGDGFGGGLSDYTLFKEAKRIGNIYTLVKVGIMTEAEKKQDEERKARGAQIEQIITTVMTTKLGEFMKW